MDPKRLGANIHFYSRHGPATHNTIRRSSYGSPGAWGVFADENAALRSRDIPRNGRFQVTVSINCSITFSLCGYPTWTFFHLTSDIQNDFSNECCIYLSLTFPCWGRDRFFFFFLPVHNSMLAHCILHIKCLLKVELTLITNMLLDRLQVCKSS